MDPVRRHAELVGQRADVARELAAHLIAGAVGGLLEVKVGVLLFDAADQSF